MKQTKDRILTVILVIYGFMVMTSCIKDELQNTECDILNAWVEGEQYEPNFYNIKQMRQDNISSSENVIIFTVRSRDSLPKTIPIYFTITPGATIEPANGTEQDFSKGPVTYTITSEDGSWKREYIVDFREANLSNLFEIQDFKFNFEHVETIQGNNKNSYHAFYEEDKNGVHHKFWASGNPGVELTKYGAKPEDFPTQSIADGYIGRGVRLTTQDAGNLGRMMGKPIAAGNLFLGKFVLENVLINPLKTTEFGLPINISPIKVTGYYKYQRGKEFTNAKMEVVPGRDDEASIYAVFYRNLDAEGNDVKLYGNDVFTNSNIMKIAQVKSLPPTDEWTRFEMYFEGKDADVQLVATQGYNMTLVFSSSKEGASFEGAIGSTLYVDEVEVTFEKDEK